MYKISSSWSCLSLIQGYACIGPWGFALKPYKCQMSLVHTHYHFKYYYLLPQWLYISIALGVVGGIFITTWNCFAGFIFILLYLKTAYYKKVTFSIYFIRVGDRATCWKINHLDQPSILSRLICKPHIIFIVSSCLFIL